MSGYFGTADLPVGLVLVGLPFFDNLVPESQVSVNGFGTYNGYHCLDNGSPAQ